MGDSLAVLLRLSMQSLVSHKVKSLIVGLIMLFGTFLLVTGASIIDGLERSMAKSIVSSLAGHLQLYDAKAQDELALFGSFALGQEDIGELKDFSQVKAAISEVDNVKDIVPMGISLTSTSAIGEVDQVLRQMREALREGDKARLKSLIPDARRVLEVLASEQEKLQAIQVGQRAQDDEARQILDKVRSDAFWQGFEADPQAGLEFLDTQVAPLAPEGRLFYLRLLGTDLDLYAKSFDRFKIATGQAVPPGKRGLLLSQRIYERVLKHRLAREFDEVHLAVTERDLSIAQSKLLQDRVRRMVRLYTQVELQLSAPDAASLRQKLAGHLGQDQEAELSALLQQFLKVDDQNVRERYAFFYDQIAPMIELYPVRVGDVITLRSFSRTGYIKAVNVKIYGTFNFEGLESSDLAGATSLTDMITFRRLYGQFTKEQAKEMEDLRERVGVEDVDRDNAEDALFGSDSTLEESDEDGKSGFDEFAGLDLKRQAAQAEAETFTQEEIERGLALNAAVLLEDPDDLDATAAAIRQKLADKGLDIKVVDWQEASGAVGQFIVVVRLVLYTAIAIIFLVALVIINNSMLMATMERVGEIGTMRAIGAQRSFVLWMFLIETVVLGLLSGGAGALVGAGFVAWLGKVGIPATADALVVLFAGPRLYPQVDPWHLLVAVLVIVVVSLGSTMYPAFIATRVQPIEAMRNKE